MQRLLFSQGQRARPPFPSGFFNASCVGSSGVRSSSSSSIGRQSNISSARWCSHINSNYSTGIRGHSFGDSSRSRPPPNNSSNSGTGPSKPAAGSNNAKTSSSSDSNTSSKDSNAKGDVATASSAPSPASQARRARRANSRSLGVGGRTRAYGRSSDGFTTLDTSSSSSSNFKLPRSLKPVEVLHAHPAQISLDGFYSLARPLLQVTIPTNSRRYPSAKDAKVMEIVGEGEFTEEQIKAGAADPFAEDQIGEYDLQLVTEPEGADPAWAEGTDKHMASLEHNMPPPAPLPIASTSSTSSSSSSSSTTVKKASSKKKVNTRQEAIDFLFPIQAEARSQEGASSEESDSLHAQISRLLGMDRAGHARDAQRGDSLTGQRFLVNQLMKHKWSGMWEWEPTRKALSAASGTAGKGKAKAIEGSSPSSEELENAKVSLRKSIDALSKISRAQAKVNARNARKAAKQSSSSTSSSPLDGSTLAAANREDLQEILEKLTKDPSNEGKTIFIQMPLEVATSRNPNFKKNKSSSSSPTGQKVAAAPSTSKQPSIDTQAVQQKIEEEVKQVMKHVKKFEGFFDKSIDLEMQSESSSSSSSNVNGASGQETAVQKALRELQEKVDADSLNDTVDAEGLRQAAMAVGAAYEAEAPSASLFEAVESSQLSEQEQQDSEELAWYAEEPPSQAAIDARHSLLGPRISSAQAYRGRSLRPTLRERLWLRDVDLVGDYKWIEMDSVKRKRRKRISKHKYKKRRKATRAERKRTGK